MPQVIVIGAGVAGLAAARALKRAGWRVQVLEARPRVGGRLDTRSDLAPVPIELGAEFVHGRPSRLFRLAKKAGMKLGETPEAMLRFQDGRLVTSEEDWEPVFRELTRTRKKDQSFAQLTEELQHKGTWTASQARLARQYVEGYMAAAPDRISVQALAVEERASNKIDGDESFRPMGGYQQLTNWLASELDAAEGELRLNTIVDELRWRRGHVEVRAHTVTGFQLPPFKADRAVITLPLGLWQAPPGTPGTIRFTPKLPEKERAVKQLAMGAVVKCMLRFRRPFWEDGSLPLQVPRKKLKQLGLLLASGLPFPTWWTVKPLDAPVLMAWAGGPSAERLSTLSEREIVQQAIVSLAQLLGVERGKLEELVDGFATANWKNDPWTRGAYSWLPAGAGGATEALAAPVEGTLFFAGEATDTEGHRGTVHGALDTGERAAREVIESVR